MIEVIGCSAVFLVCVVLESELGHVVLYVAWCLYVEVCVWVGECIYVW